MVSRFISWARLGIVAATLGWGVTAASAQGDGRFDRHNNNPGFFDQCAVSGVCGGPSTNIYRPGGDNWRRGPRPRIYDNGPRAYRYRPPRVYRHRPYRPYRPRYYDYDNGPDIYLDFSMPSYDYDQPIYPRRTYRRAAYLSAAHIEWCYSRYRTYREWDNSYVPRRGVRAQCYSPYS